MKLMVDIENLLLYTVFHRLVIAKRKEDRTSVTDESTVTNNFIRKKNVLRIINHFYLLILCEQHQHVLFCSRYLNLPVTW